MKSLAEYAFAVEPDYNVQPPNPAIQLFEGTFRLRQGRIVGHLKGRVTFRWLARLGLHFEGVASAESPDPGAKMMSSIATMIDTNDPAMIDEIIDQLQDPAGTFYRFSLPASLLGRTRIGG